MVHFNELDTNEWSIMNNLCLMTYEDKLNYKTNSLDEESCSYHELQNNYGKIIQ
jgi:hypothetical protein